MVVVVERIITRRSAADSGADALLATLVCYFGAEARERLKYREKNGTRDLVLPRYLECTLRNKRRSRALVVGRLAFAAIVSTILVMLWAHLARGARAYRAAQLVPSRPLAF